MVYQCKSNLVVLHEPGTSYGKVEDTCTSMPGTWYRSLVPTGYYLAHTVPGTAAEINQDYR